MVLFSYLDISYNENYLRVYINQAITILQDIVTNTPNNDVIQIEIKDDASIDSTSKYMNVIQDNTEKYVIQLSPANTNDTKVYYINNIGYHINTVIILYEIIHILRCYYGESSYIKELENGVYIGTHVIQQYKNLLLENNINPDDFQESVLENNIHEQIYISENIKRKTNINNDFQETVFPVLPSEISTQC